MRKMEKLNAEKKARTPSPVAATATTPPPMVSAALMKQQYDVIRYLQSTRRAMSADDIFANTGINLAEPKSRALLQSLMANDRVAHDRVTGTFAYKPGHDVRDAATLADEVARHEDGIPAAELRDSHPTGAIEADIAQAVQEGRIVAVRTGADAAQLPILFPAPRGCVPLPLLTDSVKQAWLAIKLPDDFEVERELRSVGIDALAAAPVPKPPTDGIAAATTSTGKKRRVSKTGGSGGTGARRGGKQRKLTNAHLLQQGDDI
jgi:hypothetical protein